ncbi:MAG: hypothetical protein MUC69_06100 [Gemmatimonadales bacterium]|nr:hypothetical protein [Gemmatimonadales bacterium]
MSGGACLATARSDRYRLEREPGAGGMATVHLAHDLTHERRVAITVLHPELCAVIGAERFLYVMPLIEGETVRDRLHFTLGDDRFLTGNEHGTPFNLSPDDQRFVMARVERRAADRERTFALVEQWFEERQAKVKP